MISMLSALSALLTLFRFSLPFLPPFYKLDFSESVILIGGFYLGPLSTIIMQLLKNVLKVLFFGSNSGFIGDFANFVMGVGFVLPAAIIYKKHQSFKGVIVSLIVGVVSLVIVGCLSNYYIMLPAFASEEAIIGLGKALNPNIDSMWSFVLLLTAPFNLIKGISSSIIACILYKRSGVLFK